MAHTVALALRSIAEIMSGQGERVFVSSELVVPRADHDCRPVTVLVDIALGATAWTPKRAVRADVSPAIRTLRQARGQIGIVTVVPVDPVTSGGQTMLVHYATCDPPSLSAHAGYSTLSGGVGTKSTSNNSRRRAFNSAKSSGDSRAICSTTPCGSGAAQPTAVLTPHPPIHRTDQPTEPPATPRPRRHPRGTATPPSS